MLYVRGCLIEAEAKDSQGDTLSKEDIKKININLDAVKFDSNHSQISLKGCRLLENAIHDNEVIINNTTINPGSWIITVEVNNPELEEQLLNGELRGFSIYCKEVHDATRYSEIQDASDVYPIFISFVENPANQLDFEVLDNEKYIKKSEGEEMADNGILKEIHEFLSRLAKMLDEPARKEEEEESESTAPKKDETIQKAEGADTEDIEKAEKEKSNSEGGGEAKPKPKEKKDEGEAETKPKEKEEEETDDGKIEKACGDNKIKKEEDDDVDDAMPPGLKAETQQKKTATEERIDNLEEKMDKILKYLEKPQEKPEDEDDGVGDGKKYIVKSATGKPEKTEPEEKKVESAFDAFGLKIRN